MLTENLKDFFYVCPIHLKDRGFCSPIVDAEQEAAKKKEEALAREIEKVKQEYEEKQKKKKGKEKSKDNDKDKAKDNNEEKDKDSKKTGKEDDSKTAEKEKNDKVGCIFVLPQTQPINRPHRSMLSKKRPQRRSRMILPEFLRYTSMFCPLLSMLLFIR